MALGYGEAAELSELLTARPNDAARRKRRQSASQIQRNKETRLKLLEAAGRTIGRYGYSGCSIARVTAKAKIAHGTFYLHFASQQDLFDALLPTLGSRMLDAIAASINGPANVMDLERRGAQANFDYLARHPYMYRVLAEAELFAPKAFHQYMDRTIVAYARSLGRSKDSSQLQRYDEAELETIATMLVGARTYLLMRYGVAAHTVRPLPLGTLESYLKFVALGIAGDSAAFDMAPHGSAALSQE